MMGVMMMNTTARNKKFFFIILYTSFIKHTVTMNFTNYNLYITQKLENIKDQNQRAKRTEISL